LLLGRSRPEESKSMLGRVSADYAGNIPRSLNLSSNSSRRFHAGVDLPSGLVYMDASLSPLKVEVGFESCSPRRKPPRSRRERPGASGRRADLGAETEHQIGRAS